MRYIVDNNMQTSFDDDKNETKYFFFAILPKGQAGLRNPWEDSVLILLHNHMCFI
jgi:hypothetical protein